MRAYPRVFLSACAAVFLGSPGMALAQPYPGQSPTYLPSAILPATTMTAPGNVVFQTNSTGTVIATITGSGTGIAGTFQIASERQGTPTWTSIGVQPMGGTGGLVKTITAIGRYKIAAQGAAQVQFNLTALTGSVTVDFSGGVSDSIIDVAPIRRQTYSAIITGLAPAAATTDFYTLTGSATKTVRVSYAGCSGVSTSAAIGIVQALTRSTANSAGTATNPAGSSHDPNDAAPTAVVAAYTANPTAGTQVGSGIRSGRLATSTAATPSMISPPLEWWFGQGMFEEVTLRGAAQVFALNGAGSTFAAGTALSCSLQWSEE